MKTKGCRRHRKTSEDWKSIICRKSSKGREECKRYLYKVNVIDIKIKSSY